MNDSTLRSLARCFLLHSALFLTNHLHSLTRNSETLYTARFKSLELQAVQSLSLPIAPQKQRPMQMTSVCFTKVRLQHRTEILHLFFQRQPPNKAPRTQTRSIPAFL